MFRENFYVFIITLGLLLLGSCSDEKKAVTELSNKLFIFKVAIIDVQTGTVEENQTVIIEGNYITDITQADVDTTHANVIDGRGKFLIPGLWDMHVHFSAMPQNLKLFIANGITGVRDMGSILLEERSDTVVFLSQQIMLDSILNIRNQIADGTLIGPRIMLAGLTLNGPLPEGIPVVAPFQRVVTDSSSAKAAVDELVNKEVDFIKVHALLSKEAYFAIAREAKRHNIPFAGHIPNILTPIEVSMAGQSSIEHLTGIPEYIQGGNNVTKDSLSIKKRAEELYSVFRKNNTWQTPTLTSYHGYEVAPKYYHGTGSDERLKQVPNNIQQFWRYYWPPWMFEKESDGQFFHMLIETTAALHEAEVGILAGTDFAGPFVYPGFSLHDELRLLKDSVGLSTLSTLQTATLNPAKFFGITSKFGTIKKGKVADLVLLNKNPLEEINHTKEIFAVIANGKVYDERAIESLLQD